jgi:hypothetical protein
MTSPGSSLEPMTVDAVPKKLSSQGLQGEDARPGERLGQVGVPR